MKNDQSKEINEQVTYGLDTIDPALTVTITLKDFMFIYKTFQEFNRFFHQPMHYQTIEDFTTYLGNVDAGAYAIIHQMYYHVLYQYLPQPIAEKLGETDNPFECPDLPYYAFDKNE